MNRSRSILSRQSIATLLPLGLLAFLALGLMLPALRSPPVTHDSFWIDFVWIDQFGEQLRHGTLYPRWLPRSNGGLGAPVFFFYAPLSFYWAAAFGVLGLGTYGTLLAASGAAWFASGATMWLWLRDQGQRALLGAALYMAFPYHVIDFYRRGALAEFCAYAILPLLAMAIRRAAAGRGWGTLACVYAALILTHLPVALLTSVLLIAPWCVWSVWRDLRSAMPLAGGLLLGIGLAGLYLVPALTLQSYISVEQLWGAPGFLASSWNFFAPSPWIEPSSVWLFAGMTALFAATAALFALRRDHWALWVIGACAIIAGMVPWLWDVPIMAKVQFPWRALLLVEFALATTIGRARIGIVLSVAAAAPLLFLSMPFLAAFRTPGDWTPAALAARHPEVLEYLPHGASHERGTYSPWALDLARRQPPVVRDGDRTIVARFYFPSWQVQCGGMRVAAAPDPTTKLLSYRGAGCAVRRVVLPAEWAGGALSLGSLLLLSAMTFGRRLRRKQKGPGSMAPRTLSYS